MTPANDDASAASDHDPPVLENNVLENGRVMIGDTGLRHRTGPPTCRYGVYMQVAIAYAPVMV